MTPTLKEEKKLWKQGFALVAGLDEAGRGPLAGPVVAACVIVADKKFRQIPGVKDSKLLSQAQREELYAILTSHPALQWGVGVVSHQQIDKTNILQATKLAMQKSLKGLEPNFLLLDGTLAIATTVGQQAMVKADQKVFSVAAASIIAKVTRDRMMAKYHKKYPQYGFLQHKGYGTTAHLAAIKQYGACPIHRKTFYPVSLWVIPRQ